MLLPLESLFGISRKGTDDGAEENRYGFPCDWMRRVCHTNNPVPWNTCFAWSVVRLCHPPRLEQIWMARPRRSLFFSLRAFPLGIYQEKQMTEQQLKKGLFRLWIVVSVFWVCYGIINFAPHAFDLLEVFFVLILPPVLLLILGKSIFWIFKGFMKSEVGND